MATVIVYDKERMQEIEDTAVVSGSVNGSGSLILGRRDGGSIDAGIVRPDWQAGTIEQYYRGDKSWQTLDKTAVGLSNVDNTTDLNKPISNLQKGTFIGRGNTAARDAYYGIPVTAAEKAALANQQVVWYNTTTKRFETYYATTGTAGLTVTGIVGASAWHPELSTVYRKVILAAPANHTQTDEISVTRQGGIVTFQGRTNRNSTNALFPAGTIPLGFRPSFSIFPQWAIGGNGVLGQVSQDGSSITPFTSMTGDFMFTATWSTDPTIPPF